uniref:Uncharacterized protein n=1 Tax=Rhizophora mucronata TaxID=61149 RepID=A0A2P2NH17_RHIMU
MQGQSSNSLHVFGTTYAVASGVCQSCKQALVVRLDYQTHILRLGTTDC